MNFFEKLPKEKRDRIILLSMKEFTEHGYELASTNRIVKSLGISKGSLFKYFSTKLLLYIYLVEYSTESLMNYLDENLQLEKKAKWNEYFLHYASIEFDYLIREPLIYRFFHSIIKDINQAALADVKKNLLQITNTYLVNMRKDLQLDVIFFRHILFIVKSYNEFYLENLNINELNANAKTNYLNGLSKHFEYIKE